MDFLCSFSTKYIQMRLSQNDFWVNFCCLNVVQAINKIDMTVYTKTFGHSVYCVYQNMKKHQGPLY